MCFRPAERGDSTKEGTYSAAHAATCNWLIANNNQQFFVIGTYVSHYISTI